MTRAVPLSLLLLAGCLYPDAAVRQTQTGTPSQEIDAPTAPPSALDERSVRPATTSAESPSGERAVSRKVVLLELFTSEGCSSCPPADRLLQQIHDRRDPTDEDVLVLSWHVDYWNYLGWADPFSSAEATKRQRRYAQRLQTTVFTPQLIVNGRHSAVGSRRDDVRTAMAQAARTPLGSVDASVETQPDGSLRITVDCTQTPTGSTVLAGIVQKSAKVDVARGENSGRSLDHINVVRSAQQKVVASGIERLTFEPRLPEGLAVQNASVFVLVQARDSGELLGATQFPSLPASR